MTKQWLNILKKADTSIKSDGNEVFLRNEMSHVYHMFGP